MEKPNKWIVTDIDTGQYYQYLGDNKYLFKENRRNPNTGKPEIFKREIDLDKYSWHQKVEACEAFGYSATQIDKWITEGEEQPLITECIFEFEV